MDTNPYIIEGGFFSDDRGRLSFVNDFNFADVKRFYMIDHPETDTVRAWQGHVVEKKYFYVVKGSFCIAWVKIDNWDNPSSELRAEYEILNENQSRILCVPCGYANGLKAIERASKLIVFSSLSLEESLKEKTRYDSSLWFDWSRFSAALE